MDLLIKIQRDEKLKILETYKKEALPAEKYIFENAIDLTMQSAVVRERICRVTKIFPNAHDEHRVIAGRLGFGEENGDGVRFPASATALASTGVVAQNSYQSVKDNYRKLRADVKSNVDPVVKASIQPQAINLTTLLSTEILKPKTIKDLNKIIFALDMINNGIKIGSNFVDITASDFITEILEVAKKAYEGNAPIKFRKDLANYIAALSGWMKVGNRMLDYVDPDGAWSFYDFH